MPIPDKEGTEIISIFCTWLLVSLTGISMSIRITRPHYNLFVGLKSMPRFFDEASLFGDHTLGNRKVAQIMHSSKPIISK